LGPVINSRINARFRKAFQKLPKEVQKQAKQTYRRWKRNPYQAALEFKPVHLTKPVYSVRIGLKWRAVGILENHVIVWFWIGSHEEYNKLLNLLRRNL
jgi:hypothetical protein